MRSSLKVKLEKGKNEMPSKKKDGLLLREAINERAIKRLKSMRDMEIVSGIS